MLGNISQYAAGRCSLTALSKKAGPSPFLIRWKLTASPFDSLVPDNRRYIAHVLLRQSAMNSCHKDRTALSAPFEDDEDVPSLTGTP